MQKEKQNYKRFSITMQAELYGALEQMAAARELDNRSLLIADLVKRELLTYTRQDRSRVMAGNTRLFRASKASGSRKKPVTLMRISS